MTLEEFEEFKKQFSKLEDFEKFPFDDDNGKLVALLGLSTRLFFTGGDAEPRRLDAIDALKVYYDCFGAELTHSIAGHARPKPLSEGDPFPDFRARAQHDDPDDRSFFLSLVAFPGGNPARIPLFYAARISAATPYWAQFECYSEWAVSLPFSAIGGDRYGRLLELMLRWCTLVKPRHGTSGPSFLLDQTFNHRHTGQVIYPLIRRFPGIDYDDGGNWISQVGMDQKIRSIQWLTAVDDSFVADLGGMVKLRRELGAECPLHVYDGGVVIQAGPHPKIGDEHRGKPMDAYRRVARALRPIRFERYDLGLLYPPKPLDRVSETLAWLGRFD
jgi:hypothetical protein